MFFLPESDFSRHIDTVTSALQGYNLCLPMTGMLRVSVILGLVFPAYTIAWLATLR